mgnify:FL=1
MTKSVEEIIEYIESLKNSYDFSGFVSTIAQYDCKDIAEARKQLRARSK